MTNQYADSVALVGLAAQNDLRLCVGQQMRYFRHYQVVAEFVASGELGSIEQVFFFNAKPRHQARNLKGFEQPVLWEMDLPPPGLPVRRLADARARFHRLRWLHAQLVGL